MNLIELFRRLRVLTPVDRAGTSAERRKRAKRRVQLEQLENRELMATDLRSFDGTGNNLVNVEWGSTAEDFLRVAPAAYADGISAPAGTSRASARAISNAVAAQSGDMLNNRDLSAFIYAWGQFLDHDIDLTDTGSANEKFNVPVPKGDAYFDPTGTGTKTIGLTRSAFDAATGTSVGNPRQQVNSITAFVDASQVYGSDAERAAALRTFSGGKMKTSDGNLLPYNTAGLTNAIPGSNFYVAGDVRANENLELLGMQTLFVREHNRLADKFAVDHPEWTDEQLYQQARRWVAAELQSITYNEFLPALLGQDALRPYRGYNPNVNPGIANEFSTAAFRLGHSMLGDDIEFLDNQGKETHDAVALRDAFFAPQLLPQVGIDGMMKYLASDRAQEIDTKVINDVRNFLFGAPGSGGFDLASLNIQRGRDHGLADYNSTRVAYGLRPVQSFADITSDPATQASLKSVYGDVNNIDLWVGGLAEDHVPGASVGETFRRIIADQFMRLRDGDRFWYENDFKGTDVQILRNTGLADVIRRNTTTTNLQDNVFFFRAEINGRVFADANGNGRAEQGEAGLSGVLVQLLASDGSVLATTRTNRDGDYRFQSLDLGTYRVRIVLPDGTRQTTADPADLQFTRGMRIDRLDFGVARLMSMPPKPTGPQPGPQPGPMPGPMAGPLGPGPIGPMLIQPNGDQGPNRPRRG